MNKNTYETFEAEPDQFFVVQEDGTFLLNRQIQYVTQVQDVKEVLEDVQPCTVYGVGVSSQQFFVDVENSTELISVSDQFILPDGDNSLYTNSYLLEPSSSNATEQMEEDIVVDQLKETNTQEVDIDVATQNKQANNFTEITLSDEQYQTLEQKGWILLESNDKVYILNTQGLHDITSNDKLIEKLKSEIENDANNAEPNTGTIKIENVEGQFPNLVAQSFTNQQETVEFVIGNNEEQDSTIEDLQYTIDDKEEIEAVISNDEQMYTCENSEELELTNDDEIATIKQEPLGPSSTIKINTKFIFKDIPDKIVLGKTVNGKRLVAKFVKSLSNIKQNNNVTADDTATQTVNEKVAVKQEYPSTTIMSETELVSLIKQSVRLASQDDLDPEDLKSAEGVISQLLKVPNLESSLIGHNLIITKAKNSKDEFGVISNRSNVVLVTGHVVENNDSTGFEHLPNMLQSIKTNSEIAMTCENQNLECIDHENEICTMFHVHITETKSADNVIRVSVTLNKRQLSKNLMFDIKKRHPNPVYGCSACAALFKSEDALLEHQKKECLVENEAMVVDTEKLDMVDAYAMIKTENDKSFSCTQCHAKFPKLWGCLRHVKSHLGLQDTKSETDESKDPLEDGKLNQSKEVYKCKMCRSTYFHPATLSKHILARHIKVKAK